MIFTLHIEGVAVNAPMGVAADERRLHTQLTLSATLRYRVATGFPFKLQDLIDYEAVRRLMVEEAASHEWLLENLAHRIMTKIQRRFPNTVAGEVRVRKHHFSGAFPNAAAEVVLAWPQTT